MIMAVQGELRKRLAGMEQYYDDIPSPEAMLSLVPAEVGRAETGCGSVR